MDLDFPPEVIVQFSAGLYNSGFPAEAADVLRMGLERHMKNQTLEENWKKLSDAHGGALSDARWSMSGDPLYHETINWAEKWIYFKLFAVFLLLGIHHLLGKYRKDFFLDKNIHSEKFYKILNEVPTVLLIIIILLVYLKPF